MTVRRIRKCVLRWLAIVAAAVLLVPVVGLLLFYIPPVQNLVAEWGTRLLTERTGYTVRVGELRLRFPLRVELRDVRVGELGSVERLSTRLQVGPLMQGRAVADFLTMESLVVNTDTLVPAMTIEGGVKRVRLDGLEYVWGKRTVCLRDVALISGRVALQQRQSVPRSSTSGAGFPVALYIGDVRMNEVAVEYHTQALHLDAAAAQISLHESAIDTMNSISLQRLTLADGAVSLHKDSVSASAAWQLSELNVGIDSIHYTPSVSAASAVLTGLSFVEAHGMRLHEGMLAFAWDDGIVRLPRFSFRTDDSYLDGHLRQLTTSSAVTMLDGDLNLRLGYPDAMRLAAMSDAVPDSFALLYPVAPLDIAVALDGPLDALRITACEVSLDSAFALGVQGRIDGLPDWAATEAMLQLKARTYDVDFVEALLDTALQRRLAIPRDVVCEGTVAYAPDSVYAQMEVLLAGGSVVLDGGYGLRSRRYVCEVSVDSLDLHSLLPTDAWGVATLRADVAGQGFDYMDAATSLHAFVRVDSLQWGERLFSGASLQATLADRRLEAEAAYSDALMRFRLNATARYAPHDVRARLLAQVFDLDVRGLQLMDTDVRPSLQCNLLLRADSSATYVLRGRFHDMAFVTPDRVEYPRPLDFRAAVSADSLSLTLRAGDLRVAAQAHTAGFPWQWSRPAEAASYLAYLGGLHAEVSVGTDNPVTNYLALSGIGYRSIRAAVDDAAGGLAAQVAVGGFALKGVKMDTATVAAHYAGGQLQARLLVDEVVWAMPQMQLSGSAAAMVTWDDTFSPDALAGTLMLSDLRYTMPAYGVQVHSADTLALPFVQGGFSLRDVALYTTGRQPLLLNGRVELSGGNPSLQLQVDAKGVNLLQERPTHGTQLYGKALADGRVVIGGPFSALVLSGSVALRAGSSIHYIYRDAMLTAGNQLDDVVTFVAFDSEAPPLSTASTGRYRAFGFGMNLNVNIDPTVQLEVLLGASGQNAGVLQGGGNLNLQYIPASGLRLSGRYTVESGELTMNVPLLHVNRMTVRPGSTVVWSGNAANPMLDVSAEDRIRASVTMDGAPQSVLFVAGVSLTDTMDKLGLQFTLAAPENASMQNILAALSPEERSKLAVALLTTGLYLGEGGTGNLMNTALMGFLQSQLDNISRDAFRTVDVSVGIEPLQDGVSGVSTRTDYSFSIAKRFWGDRIRVVVGGSVTTSNERIENEAIIDNISVEWRIRPNGSQYLRFFYDKNFESILEGEIRETGVGYAYRRRF